MPKHLLNRWHGLHIKWGIALIAVLCATLAIFQWMVAVVALLLGLCWIYYVIMAEKAFRADLQNYVLTLTHRIKKAGNEVVQELPIGIVLFNEAREIEWHNPFVGRMFGQDSLVGETISDLFPTLQHRAGQEEDAAEVEIDGNIYRIIVKSEERLYYILNITDYVVLAKKYEEEKLALGIVMLDNLDEISQGMDDQTRSLLMAKVVGEITEWTQKHGIYLRRLAADKFMLIMDRKTLQAIEQDKFDILDEVRDITMEYKLPLTLSIGVSSGTDDLMELGSLVQASLDIALGRGGDQAAVKDGERLSFYGGRSNAMEKRTRVRARVISHALRDLIRASDKVVIMGHKIPDMDSVGAAIGVLKAAQLANKEGYIVIEGENPGIERLMDEVRKRESIHKWIIGPEQAMQITHSNTLIVVVDTHKPSMVAEPKILQQSGRIVVVDHHRRSEEFINEATLIYMEPYASSTCELVTELLQYFHERVSMDAFEATALLAGIAVDTKSFAQRTGARTFEAASFLRRNGADTTLVQSLLKEDLAQFNNKAELIRNAQIHFGRIAVAKGEAGRKYSQLLIAQTADTLLNMSGVAASFVISERIDGGVGISARSLGEINVQVVMERFGGGGHLTHAAAQLEGTLDEAEQNVMQVLQEMFEEKG